MARRRGTRTTNAKKRDQLASKLIGAGLVLTVMPLFLGRTPAGAALRPLILLGILILAIGGILLWLKIRPPSNLPRIAQVVSPIPSEAASPRQATVHHPVDHASRDWDTSTRSPPPSAGPERRRPTHWGPAVLDVIEWRRFEALVEALYAQSGMVTQTQSHGADQGIDIWLYSRSSPGAPVSIVQCKHWSGKPVGVDKVRELRGVMAAKNVSRGQFATTSRFTPDAIAFARENGIHPLDAGGLLKLIGTRTAEQQLALLEVALAGDYWRPTCVNCGVKMAEKAPRKGGKAFWGCVHFPRCKTTMPMRARDSAEIARQ